MDPTTHYTVAIHTDSRQVTATTTIQHMQRTTTHISQQMEHTATLRLELQEDGGGSHSWLQWVFALVSAAGCGWVPNAWMCIVAPCIASYAAANVAHIEKLTSSLIESEESIRLILLLLIFRKLNWTRVNQISK